MNRPLHFFLLAALVLPGCGGSLEDQPLEPGDASGDTDASAPFGPVKFLSSPVVAAHVGGAYEYDAEATQEGNPAPLVYALDKSPPGMTIDAATGLTSWTPTASQKGKHSVAIRATSSDGQFAVQEFVVGVDSPVITAVVPAAGPATGDQVVRIKGAGFKPSTLVDFGKVPAKTVKLIDESTLEVTTPRTVAGTQPVFIKSAAEAADTLPTGFTFLPVIRSADASAFAIGDSVRLEVDGLDPSMPETSVLSLPGQGRTWRRIVANKADATSAAFGLTVGPAQSNLSTGSAAVIVHGLQSNSVPIRITNSSLPPRMAATAFLKGTVAGTITLTGAGFTGIPAYDGTGSFDLSSPTALYVVLSGTTRPAKVLSVDSTGTSVSLEVPPEAVTGPVRLFAPGRTPETSVAIAHIDGTKATLGAVGFTPPGGPAGTVVVIDGCGFSANPVENEVAFGGKSAAVLSADAERLVVQTPKGLSLGGHAITVKVGSNTTTVGIFGSAGALTTIAGGGTVPAAGGDGGPASSASTAAGYVTVDAVGNYLLGDGARVRFVNTTSGVVTAFGKTFPPGVIDTIAEASKLPGAGSDTVGAVAIHPTTGDAYAAFGSRIFRIQRTDGNATLYAGGEPGFSGDGGYRVNAAFREITDLRFTTASGYSGTFLLVADNGNGRVRAINTTLASASLWGVTVGPELISTVEEVYVANPVSIAIDKQNDLYVSRFRDVVVIRHDRPTRPAVPPSEYTRFDVVAGASSSSTSLIPGTGCPATAVSLGINDGIALDDTTGHLFIGSRSGLVRRLYKNSTGESCIEFVAGKRAPGAALAEIGYGGDGGNALESAIALLSRPFLDRSGNLLIPADGRIRRVQFGTDTARTPGTIQTVIGTGVALPSAGALGTALGSVDFLTGVVVDGPRNRYLYGVSRGLIFAQDRTSGIITRVAGVGVFGNQMASDAMATGSAFGSLRGIASAGDRMFVLETVLPRVSEVNLATGKHTVVAGDGIDALPAEQQTAGTASSSRVAINTGAPKAVVGPDGALYFGDNNLIRIVNVTTASVTSFGTTIPAGGIDFLRGSYGSNIGGLAFDKFGNLFISSYDNHRIYVKRNDSSKGFPVDVLVQADGERYGVTTPGTVAELRLNGPSHLAFSPAGDLLVADSFAGTLLAIQPDSTGNLTASSPTVTLLGVGVLGAFTADPSPAAAVGELGGMAFDGTDLLLTMHNRLVRMTLP